MVQGIEQRKCHRFEIPGANLMYRRIGLIRAKKYINAIRLYNISKGGLAFACADQLPSGKTIIIKLYIPDSDPLELLATVRWQRISRQNDYYSTGLSFNTFGPGSNMNPVSTLNTLRQLDQKYVQHKD